MSGIRTKQLDEAARRAREAIKRSVPVWIGTRVAPPLEQDHPLKLEIEERIKRRHGNDAR